MLNLEKNWSSKIDCSAARSVAVAAPAGVQAAHTAAPSTAAAEVAPGAAAAIAATSTVAASSPATAAAVVLQPSARC